MIEQLFNPVVMPYVKVFVLFVALMVLFVAIMRTIGNMLSKNKTPKEKTFWNNLLWSMSIVGIAGIMAVGLFMFLGSLMLI